ncbi:hypothetical protein [Micromonospora sp. NPDC023633]|uniref:hypothetical protein n=1 Tax=Micromonospora sp. NPDC023633 TaxID=3154320 RepID=UPI0033FDF429
MAKKMLGKVVAGAALGGASLLVFTPGIAFADGQQGHEGKVYAKPHVVKAGDTVKLLEVCPDRQEHAFVWSKVTGKVELKPAEGRGDWRGGEEDSRDHDRGRDHEDKGRDNGKDGNGKDQSPRPQPPANGTSQPQPTNGGQPPANGQGGGAADAAGAEGDRDWKGYEHGQDAEGDRGDKGHDKGNREGRGDSNGSDEYDRADRKDHAGYGSESNGSDEYDRKGHDNGRDGHDNGRDGHDNGRNGRDGHDNGRNGHDNGRSDEESERNGKDHWEHKRDFVYYGEAQVSEDAQPGRYELKGSCGEGELVVLPRGGVDGGDGGVGAGTDRGLAAGGASLIGAAALGGLVLMRRRRTDESFV